MRKISIWILAAVLMTGLLSACTVKKAKVNIDDYGDETRTTAAETETAAPETTETVTEETAAETTEETAEETTEEATEETTEETAEETTEDLTEDPDALPDGWTRIEETFEPGDVEGVETHVKDEKGRDREFLEEKRSEEYSFHVEFRTYYTYTDGSPDVAVRQEFYTYDPVSGELTGAGTCDYVYTMLSPENSVSMWCGWEESADVDENGLKIQVMTDYNGQELNPDGTTAREIPSTKP